jgi:hypothetical protein
MIWNCSAAGECLEHSWDDGGKEGAVYARVLTLVEKIVAMRNTGFV